MRTLVMVVCLIGASAATAAAQPSRPFQLELTGGFRAGGNGVVGEGRLFAAWAHHVGIGDRRSVFVAAGFEGTAGTVAFDDPRGVDGALTAPRRTFGPTARVGLAWARDGSWPTAYIYASATGLVAETRTDSIMLVESGRSTGARFAIGASLPGSYAAFYAKADDDDCDGDCSLAIILALLPNTVEISGETLIAGGEAVQRWGLGLGWSL